MVGRSTSLLANNWKAGLFAVAALALGVVQPVAAQELLKFKQGKAWTHSHSGISVPATLADTPRTSGFAYVDDNLDVSVAFAIGNYDEALTLYIFRNTNGAVPVWFAQAQWGLERRGDYFGPVISMAPQSFTPPGQATASGLWATYEPKGGRYRSSGVALMPVGQWYVKLRASSTSRSPTEMASWMAAALASVTWPSEIPAAPEAVRVTACAAPLAFSGTARDAPKDGAADVLGGLLGMMAGQEKVDKTPELVAAETAARWCRDTQLDNYQAAYRRDADPERYLLAVGDNGNGIWVGPDDSAQLLADANVAKSPARFSISLMTAAQTVNFVAQDRLPSPQRVLDIVDAGRSTTTVPTWGKNKKIEVNSNGF